MTRKRVAGDEVSNNSNLRRRGEGADGARKTHYGQSSMRGLGRFGRRGKIQLLKQKYNN